MINSSGIFEHEIELAIDWLLNNRSSIGGWSGPFPDREWSGAWTTSGVLLAYWLKRDVQDESIEKATKWLVSQQNNDGGWPRIQSDLSSTESTAWAIMALALGSPNSKYLRRGINWLLQTQSIDGGWDFHHTTDCKSRVIPTSFVCIAFYIVLINSGIVLSDELRSQLNNSLQSASLWILAGQKPEGSWANTRGGKVDNMSTALAILSLSHSNKILPIKSLSKVLSKSQKWLISRQLETGEWEAAQDRILYKTLSSTSVDDEPVQFLRDLYWDWFSTPWVLVALVESGVNVASESIQKGIKILLDLQLSNGGWASKSGDPPMFWSTYQIVYCLHSLSSHLDAPTVYNIFTTRLQARDEMIKQLNSNPRLAEDHHLLVREIGESAPIIFGTELGLYSSQKLAIIFIIFSIFLFSALLTAIIAPNLLFLLFQSLNIGYLKITISILSLVEGCIILYLINKIIKMSKENLYVTVFGFIIGILFYLLS